MNFRSHFVLTYPQLKVKSKMSENSQKSSVKRGNFTFVKLTYWTAVALSVSVIAVGTSGGHQTSGKRGEKEVSWAD